MDIIEWTQIKLLNPEILAWVFVGIGLGLMTHSLYHIVKDR
jgi:hypothetical protein